MPKCDNCSINAESVQEYYIKSIDAWIDACEDCRTSLDYEEAQLNRKGKKKC